MTEASFHISLPSGRTRCVLCPHRCELPPGGRGKCRVRVNENGKIFSVSSFVLAAAHTDPIEKKPLFHFYPGKSVFSVGSAGCNMACPFCQNYEISGKNVAGTSVTLERVLSEVRSSGGIGLAYTYTEPTVWIEFVAEASRAVKEAGFKNVLVSNGNINQEPLSEIIPFIDAANIDVKTFDSEKYRTLGGDLASVINTLETMASYGTHIEISSLIVPGLWTEKSFLAMCKRIAGINPLIPLHVNRYFPAYRFDAPPTDAEMLKNFRKLALTKLKYVYIGNAADKEAAETRCHGCGAALIKRNAGRVETCITEAICPNCGIKLNIIL